MSVAGSTGTALGLKVVRLASASDTALSIAASFSSKVIVSLIMLFAFMNPL